MSKQNPEMSNTAIADAQSVLSALKSDMQSVFLSTLGEDGEPHCSYTPFVYDDQPATEHHMLIFVSQLSEHTRDLLCNGKVSTMLISDESVSAQIFARTRVKYQCRAERIKPTDDSYDMLLNRLQEKHGKLVGLLRTLPDFVLFRLVPLHGLLVKGFGKAYKLQGEKLDQLEHVEKA